MYKVLLIDDEYVVREGIKNNIDWQRHAFEPIAAYSNGREAIEAIEAGYRPDLIITDICMPFVDGLEFAKYITEKDNKALIIILSGYDDFKFAQQAIKLNVYDYILKPITASGMCELIDRAKIELDKRQSTDRQIVQLENSVNDAIPLLRMQFLNALVKSKVESKKISLKLKEYDIQLGGNCFIVAIVDIDNIDYVSKFYYCAPPELLKYAVFNVAQEISQNFASPFVFQSENGRTILIFSINDENCNENTPKIFIAKIASLISKNLNFTVSAGIGRSVDNLSQLHSSLHDAEYAIGYRFFNGDNSIISKKDIIEPSGTHIDFSYYEKTLSDSLKSCSQERVIFTVREFLEILDAKKLKYDRCIYYIHRMMISVVDLISDLNIDESSIFLNDAFEQINQLPVDTLAEAGECLTSFCKSSLDYMSTLKSTGTKSIAHNVEQYVKCHYSDPTLTLGSIAATFSVSVSYFCSIFKSYTGKTFIEYLNQFRIEKAKELLKITGKNIYEIASDVGYTDQHYFSIAFKKSTGLTPKKFRENGNDTPL